MKTGDINQTVIIKAQPDEVYRALLDAREHAAFTGSAAQIEPKVGTPFSAYDGYITGKNLQLKEDKKIVQAWRADEEGWPEGHWSKVTIALKLTKGGTELRFHQTNIPERCLSRIADGWGEFYWQPLKRMLER
ncbi:MAG: SRPBCC family protein [bacterium]